MTEENKVREETKRKEKEQSEVQLQIMDDQKK